MFFLEVLVIHIFVYFITYLSTWNYAQNNILRNGKKCEFILIEKLIYGIRVKEKIQKVSHYLIRNLNVKYLSMYSTIKKLL